MMSDRQRTIEQLFAARSPLPPFVHHIQRCDGDRINFDPRGASYLLDCPACMYRHGYKDGYWKARA